MMDVKAISTSPSKIAMWDNCRWQYFLKEVVRVSTQARSSNLIFGSCYDEVWNQYLTSVHQGKLFNPRSHFANLWDHYVATTEISYNSKIDEDGMRDIGLELVDIIPHAWHASGFQLLLDKDGKPVLQQTIAIDVGNNITHRMKLDVAVIDRDNDIAVVDNKTITAQCPEENLTMVEQVFDYQIGMDAIAPEHGWNRVAKIGFWEGKKAKEPMILEPKLRDRASDREINERLQKIHVVADDIRSGKFYRTPRMAHNSPCGMCEFYRLCSSNGKDRMGFIIGNPQYLDLQQAA